MGAVVGVSMLHISNMRIPARIAIATILPLLAFAGFAVLLVRHCERRKTISQPASVILVSMAGPRGVCIGLPW